ALAFVSETKIVGDVQACDVWLRGCRADPRHLTVRKVGHTVGVAEGASAGQFGIDVETRAVREPHTEENGRGNGRLGFAPANEAERTLVRRRERAMILADGGGLVEQVPSLRQRVGLRGEREIAKKCQSGYTGAKRHHPSMAQACWPLVGSEGG